MVRYEPMNVQQNQYDSVIIGAGPSGLTAGMYATMYGLSTVVIGDVIGGKLVLAPGIIDYPGFERTTGPQLVAALTAQLNHAGVTVQQDMVTSVAAGEGELSIQTQSGASYQSKTIIIAAGNGNKQRDHHAKKLCEMIALFIAITGSYNYRL